MKLPLIATHNSNLLAYWRESCGENQWIQFKSLFMAFDLLHKKIESLSSWFETDKLSLYDLKGIQSSTIWKIIPLFVHSIWILKLQKSLFLNIQTS